MGAARKCNGSIVERSGVPSAKGKARKIADDARRLTMTFYGEEMIPFPEFTEDFLKANMQRLQEKFAQVRASTTNSH